MQAPLSRTASGEVSPFVPDLDPAPPPLPPLLFGHEALSATLLATRSGTWTATNRGSRLLESATAARPGDGSSLSRRVTVAPDGNTVAEGAGLAHDAGNLLGALRLYSDLLAQPGVLRQEHRHYAEEIRLLSGRSGRLIERLLRSPVAAPQEGPSVPATAAPPPSNCFAVVPEVVERCRGLLEILAGRALRVLVDSGTSAPVGTTGEAIERVLVNLIRNAAEASPSGTPITLRVRTHSWPPSDGQLAGHPSGRVVLSVEDQGGGMTGSAARLLLSEEDPAPLTTGQTRGLGLRVVRELARQAHAQLRLHTDRNGTRIEIGWPVAGKPVGSTQGNRAPLPERPAHTTAETTTQNTLRRIAC